jgi:hypothetical protein
MREPGGGPRHQPGLLAPEPPTVTHGPSGTGTGTFSARPAIEGHVLVFLQVEPTEAWIDDGVVHAAKGVAKTELKGDAIVRGLLRRGQ